MSCASMHYIPVMHPEQHLTYKMALLFFMHSNTTEEGDISIFLCLLTFKSEHTSVYAPSSRQEKQYVVNKVEQKLIADKLNSTLSLIGESSLAELLVSAFCKSKYDWN